MQQRPRLWLGRLTKEEVRLLKSILTDRFIYDLDANSVDEITGRHGAEIAQQLKDKIQ
jgi:hypothetical protein